MVTAVVPNADALIEERRASGEDRYDEIINGVYYMVPPTSSGHGRRQLALGAALLDQGLIVASEAGVGFPDDYVIPDLVAYRHPIDDDTIYAEPDDVRFVVEILSESNAGPHWEAKLARLADWQIPVVISDESQITNLADLPVEVAGLFAPQ